MENLSQEHHYDSANPTWSNSYLWEPVRKLVLDECSRESKGRLFELGCGNGATANMLTNLGLEVVAVDPSEPGITVAQSAFPETRFELGSAYDDLAGRYGTFPIVLSLEVVEHCFWPRKFSQTVFDLIEPGGVAIISTPYHGYLKNLAIALAGKFDSHWSPLWDGGHIKFWSIDTLTQLLEETGFHSIEFRRIGRIPPLAKSMIAIARR